MASSIKIEGKIINGVFEKRLNRFSALVKVGNKTLRSFLPNPGRLCELLTPGAEVMLKEALGGDRKTSYDLIGVYYEGQRISVDSRVPNKLVLEALRKKELKEFSNYNTVKPEYPYGHTRFDFLLSDRRENCLLEVKSCTLVKNGVAMFPDAKTERGRRHVKDLLKAQNKGYRACMLFIEFGKVLRCAATQGVEVYAYCSEFIEDKILLRRKVEVTL